MWPWGHVAVGYLAYSLGRRLLGREPPTDLAVLVLLPASLLPDLVDKPLSWWLDLFPTGYAVGHSALVAIPLGLAALAAGVRRDRVGPATAFVVGYWSHLAGDVFSGVLLGDGPAYGVVLWPLVERAPYATEYGAVERGLVYLREFATAAATAERPLALIAVYLAPGCLALLLWLLDGGPGLRTVTRSARWVARR